MTIDSHHHFWNYDAEEYGWIGDGMDVLKRDFGPADLKPLLDKAGIDGVISVQARTDEKENRFLLDYAKQHDWILGVVGWVDLNREDIGDRLAAYAENTKLVAMRHVLQGESDDRYCLREDFNRGIAALHDHGLAYDILIKQHQLPPIPEFVDRHQGQVFVIDHIAKPVIAGPTADAIWSDGMKAVAERDNVFCKISGVVTEVTTGLEVTPELMRPYFDLVLEAFGPERLMFGSDWPVCLLRSPYVPWSATVREWIGELSADEQSAILGGTAARAYRLGA